ncbi:MAG: L-threonylcarbamoyladenylate synthase [Acidobacteriota bacterium]|nr:L-threonylcarbamoyladenylate synthase [Acidobacteriota bacterium]
MDAGERPAATTGLCAADVAALEECAAAGGVAIVPTDTVYGLMCDPCSSAAVERLHEIKGRPPWKPSAVMFFSLEAALAALPELGERERHAMRSLLPGPVTVLLENRRARYPLASGAALGLRVPALDGTLSVLAATRSPLMQSSANLSGQTEARRLAEIPRAVRDAADLVLDGGELAGLASTVLDLRALEDEGRWEVLRAGPLSAAEIARRLG